MNPPKTRDLRPEALRGSVLTPNAAIEQEYAAVILTLVRRMCDDTKKAMQQVFAGEKPEIAPHEPDAAMDAADPGTSTQARIALNALMDKYEPLFNRWAKKATKRMMDRTVKNSGVTLGMSLRQMSTAVQLDASKMSPALLEIINASTTEAVSLIKLIPAKYLTNVQGAVSRSITTGNGMQDLVPYLEKQYAGNIRHARNVAHDQTRKAYNNTTAARMESIGVTQYEWIHSAGPKEPRALHVSYNGKVFDLKDPPFIGEMYGQDVYGKPGDMPNCFVGSTKVSLANGCRHLWRFWYEGDIVCLTVGASTIECTPNHPILTQRGWLPANEIEEGDYLASGGGDHRRGVDAEVDESAPTFDELFVELSRSSLKCKAAAEFDFHGDRPEHDVDCVAVHGDLTLRPETVGVEQVEEFALALSDGLMLGVDLGSFAEVFESRGAGVAREGGQVAATELPESHAHRGTPSTRHDSVVLQDAVDHGARDVEPSAQRQGADACVVVPDDLGGAIARSLQAHDAGQVVVEPLLQSGDDFSRTKPELLHERANSRAPIKAFLQVQKKVVRVSACHVYTMESCCGWYMVATAEVISKNCRCRMRPVLNFTDD